MGRSAGPLAILLTAVATAAGAIGPSASLPGVISPHGEVTIPTAEYRALREAVESARKVSAEEAGAAITAARFRLAVEGETATFHETFSTSTSANGWIALPLADHSFSSFSFAPAGRGFLFESSKKTRLALLGPGSGTGVLEKTIASEIDGEGRQSLSIDLPLFPVQSGVVEIPGTQLEIEVRGGDILSRSESAEETKVEVVGRPGQAFSVRYRPKRRETKAREAPLVASAVVYARSEISGGSLVTDLFVRVDIKSGDLSRIDFALPKGSRMVFLRGRGLIGEEPSEGLVRGIRSAPSGESLEAQLRVLRPLSDESSIEIPLPRLLLGTVEVYAEFRPPAEALAELVSPGDYRIVEPETLPASQRERASEAQELLRLTPQEAETSAPIYRLHRLDPARVLTAQVRSMRGFTIVSRSGGALSRIDYDVVSSAKAFLSLHLPEGASVWGAEVSGRPIRPASPDKGIVAIPLRSGRSRASHVVLKILGPVRFPEGRGVLEIPIPSTSVPISRLTWSLSLPGGARYRLQGHDYEEGTGTALAELKRQAATGSPASELAKKAREAMREEKSLERPPVAPRVPEIGLTLSARAELPAEISKPIRLEVEPDRERRWE